MSGKEVLRREAVVEAIEESDDESEANEVPECTRQEVTIGREDNNIVEAGRDVDPRPLNSKVVEPEDEVKKIKL